MTLLDTELAILQRLAAHLAAGSVLIGTFNAVDLTDDGIGPVVGQVRLERINSGFSVKGSAAQIQLLFSFSVFCDVPRTGSTEQAAAAQMLQDAGNALVSWQYEPSTCPEIVDGPDTAFDGRILRLGFAFSINSYFSG